MTAIFAGIAEGKFLWVCLKLSCLSSSSEIICVLHSCNDMFMGESSCWSPLGLNTLDSTMQYLGTVIAIQLISIFIEWNQFGTITTEIGAEFQVFSVLRV
ncbi:unnamed protein product [Urochloa humidicola]